MSVELTPQRYEENVSIDRLTPHPENYREGNSATIQESLKENGQYGAIHVQTSTGYIVKGNNTFREAIAMGARSMRVFWHDIDDAHALRILTADNKTSDDAKNNERRLAQVLVQMTSGREDREEALRGTGWTGSALDELLAKLQKQDTPPGEFPGFGHDIDTAYCCPSCGYEWSGNPKPGSPVHQPETASEGPRIAQEAEA